MIKYRILLFLVIILISPWVHTSPTLTSFSYRATASTSLALVTYALLNKRDTTQKIITSLGVGLCVYSLFYRITYGTLNTGRF